jgi:P27 family predicted phage terminase small subunit
LKQLAGNPGHRKLNAHEPQLERAIPKCPTQLSAEARREWKRITEQLYAAGLIANLDRSAIAIYCEAWATWGKAKAEVRKYGHVAFSSNGTSYQHPSVGVMNTAAEMMRKMLIEFGCTAASRSKVVSLPGAKEKSLADELFDGVTEAKKQEAKRRE